MKEFIEKLIGRLEELKASGNPYDSYWDEAMYRATELVNSTSNKTIDGVIEIVNRLAKEYRQDLVKDSQGWIPVSERLPEDSGYYLVVYHDWSDGNYLPKYDDVRVKVMHYQVKDLATGYSGWNYPRTIGENADLIEADQHREVTHWKSLPSLSYQPKGE